MLSTVQAAAVRACRNKGNNLMFSVNATTTKHCRLCSTAVYATSSVVLAHNSRQAVNGPERILKHGILLVLKVNVKAQSAYCTSVVLLCRCCVLVTSKSLSYWKVICYATYHVISSMLGLQDKLALQKAASETKDGVVKGLSASDAHIDLQVDQVINQENRRNKCIAPFSTALQQAQR